MRFNVVHCHSRTCRLSDGNLTETCSSYGWMLFLIASVYQQERVNLQGETGSR